MDEEKKKQLDIAMNYIKKQFGDGAIMTLGDRMNMHKCDVIPTGAISLDLALGIGGVAKGRVVEIFGAESSGKSTLATHIAANAQKQGGVVAYIDAEHALDPDYARKIGVDVEKLVISQPNSGEEALNIAEHLVRSGAIDLVIVDSVAALVPKSELEGEMGDTHIGLQARMMSQALRKLTAILARSNICAIFINQIREKIGVMFGSPKTTPGGNALKFYASVRIEISRISNIKKGDETVGSQIKARVVKNKLAPPFKVAYFSILYNLGIDPYGSLIDVAITSKLMEQKGSWIKYGEYK